MNTDINDASIPIYLIQCQPCSSIQCMSSVRWNMTLAIHFNMPSLAQQYQQQYCIRHLIYYDPMVFKCWPDVGPTIKQHCVNVSCLLGRAPGIISRPYTATLTKCWASVVDGVPALNQCWLHVIVQRYACLGQSVPEAYTTADTRRR